ncbi:2'-5' RNA ligase family protein [Brevibacillus ginsengisoli]|uniref:2'-5' RNA ligase family protein n=1 Tax=Brevibacillus ginsengisoli TaxID=363854 RepID=UPI003CF291E3
MKKYSLVIFPSNEVQEVANSYRKRYDSHFALISPFIRLVDTFELDEEKVPGLVQNIQQAAESTDAFTVKFHRVSTFHPTSNTLYLAVQNKEPFEKLHLTLVEYLGLRAQSFAFVPHVTIGRNLTDDECKDVAGQLRMMKFDLDSEIDSFQLISEEEDKTWKVVQSFNLKG